MPTSFARPFLTGRLLAVMVSLIALWLVPTVGLSAEEEVPKATSLTVPLDLTDGTSDRSDDEEPSPHATAGDERHAAAGHPNFGKDLGLWTMLPFAGTLLCIAVLPLVAGHWWEHNKNKGIVAAAFAIPVAIYLVAAFGRDGVAVLNHAVLGDYVPFIVLLGALYIISGGIVIEGSLSGTPLLNTGIMGFGAIIANLIGTTGASVLLIRPLLRANAPRKRKAHIVLFFIFTVSNCGGLLTPLGDPPLFMGFQAGVPFLWTAALWKEWLMVNVILLVIFNVWDQIVIQKEELAGHEPLLEQVQHHAPLRVLGYRNILFLFGVVAAIFAQGQEWLTKPMQVATLLVLTATAYAVTPRINREKNRFTFGPIIEVAVLFAGIFVTMAPALLILNAWGSGDRKVLGMALGLTQAWEYFWATGILSSFLDNAPTYLTFAATASGQQHIAAEGQYLRQLLATETGPALMAAVSCGAVFMGANTYIGNGPNFMVKAIAEEGGVKMPSFFGYMLYSGAILLPVFCLVTLVFFRG